MFRNRADKQYKVCVIGAGTRFLSGISHYTYRLACAFREAHEVSVIAMRQLLPTSLYPGRDRVGRPLAEIKYPPDIALFDGVDWYWVPTILKAIAFLVRQRPDFVVFQWWTGTVLHSYVILALVARMIGCRVFVEFHEIQDTGEAKLALANLYAKMVLPALLTLAQGFVTHSEHDRAEMGKVHRINNKPSCAIRLGPIDLFTPANDCRPRRNCPDDCCNILFFGVIRPYKGLEELVRAFDSIDPHRIEGFWLTVVGETWEDWRLPEELMTGSRYRDRITFVNRYIADDEVGAYFAGADVVALPYRRSTASGPLHIAMAQGLPVVTTQVGGLPEAVGDYAGAYVVKVGDADALREALLRASEHRHERFQDPLSWQAVIDRYLAFMRSSIAPLGEDSSGQAVACHEGHEP